MSERVRRRWPHLLFLSAFIILGALSILFSGSRGGTGESTDEVFLAIDCAILAAAKRK